MIVVFGGAFNPPTLAHKEIYHLINDNVDLEKFIFLPVSKKYSKAALIDDEHRINMLKILAHDLEKADISALEMERQSFLGTYASLERIKANYPQKTIAFVLGADNLRHLHRWINAELLIKEYKFIVVNRHNQDLDKLISKQPLLNQFKNNFIIINHFDSIISSSLFRDTLDPDYVDEDIYHYIMKHDLYKGDHHE